MEHLDLCKESGKNYKLVNVYCINSTVPLQFKSFEFESWTRVETETEVKAEIGVRDRGGRRS